MMLIEKALLIITTAGETANSHELQTFGFTESLTEDKEQPLRNMEKIRVLTESSQTEIKVEIEDL